MLEDKIRDVLKAYLQTPSSCRECNGIVDDIIIEKLLEDIITEIEYSFQL
jgi:hypothetical protein